VAHLVVSRNLSVRETENILSSGLIVRKRHAKELRRSPFSDVEERLQKRLGTKVSVLNGRRGGKVIIHYFSPAELDGLLEQLLQ
jgi:ParB family chromosome partitioning protein